MEGCNKGTLYQSLLGGYSLDWCLFNAGTPSYQGNRQFSTITINSGTLRRKMKGHVRNQSAKIGDSGGSENFLPGRFKSGHSRNESILSKISRLSVLTLSKPICIGYWAIMRNIFTFFLVEIYQCVLLNFNILYIQGKVKR